MRIDVLTLELNEDGEFGTESLERRLAGRDVKRCDPLLMNPGEGRPTLALVVASEPAGSASAPDHPPAAAAKPPRVRDWRSRLAEGDQPCFDALREWRKLAAARDNVAAFIVMTNRVLASLAATRPQDDHELLQIPGIGELTVTRYGDEVLAVLSEHVPEP